MSETPPVRVVLIDRDPQLLARVEGELTRAGMQVETLSSTLGLTPELLALSSPDVVLLDTGLPGLPPDVIPAIFTDLRRRRQLRCMIVADGSREQVAQAAAQAGADAGVPRSALAQAGARALKEHSTPAAPAMEADPLASVPDVQRPQVASRPQTNAPPVNILDLIEDELSQHPPPAQSAVTHVEASLDLFSEHSLYVGRGGTLDTGGVFLATSLPPPVGTPLTLSITVFRKVKASVQGTVAWSTPARGRNLGGCGVSLVGHLPDDLKKALGRLLEERRPLTWLPPKASG